MGAFQKCSLFSSIGWHTYYVVGVIGAGTHTMSLWHTIFMCAPRATHAPARAHLVLPAYLLFHRSHALHNALTRAKTPHTHD